MLKLVSTVVISLLAAALAFVYGLNETTSRMGEGRSNSADRLVTFLDFDDEVGYSRLSLDDARLLENLLGIEVYSIAIEDLVLGENASGPKVSVAVVTREAAVAIGLPITRPEDSDPFALVTPSLAKSYSESIRFTSSNQVFDSVVLDDATRLTPALEGVDIIVVDDFAQLLDNEMVEQLEGETRVAYRQNQPNRILFASVPQSTAGDLLRQSFDEIKPLRTNSVKWETSMFSATLGTRSGIANIVALEGLWGDPKWKQAIQSAVDSSGLILWITLISGIITFVLAQVLRLAEQRDRMRLLSYLGASPSHFAGELFRRIASRESAVAWLGAALAAWAVVRLYQVKLNLPQYLVPDPFVVCSSASVLALLLIFGSTIAQATWISVETASGALFRLQSSRAPVALILFAALCGTLLVAVAAVVPIGLELKRNIKASEGFPVDSLHMIETDYSQFPPPMSGSGILKGLNERLVELGGDSGGVGLVSGLPPFDAPISVLVHPVAEQATELRSLRVLGSTSFFEITGIPIVAGNPFSTAPGYGLVLSESLAVSLFGSITDCIGRGVVMREGDRLITFSVVGVARDIPHFSNIVYRSTDISPTSQIWTSKLLVKSDLESSKLGASLASALRLGGLRAVRVRPLQDLLTDANRPMLVAVLVFASLISLLLAVMAAAIVSSVLSIVRAKQKQLTLLWRLGASEPFLAIRTLSGVLIAWAIGSILGGLTVVFGLRSVSWDSTFSLWAASVLFAALILILGISMYTARAEIRRLSLAKVD